MALTHSQRLSKTTRCVRMDHQRLQNRESWPGRARLLWKPRNEKPFSLWLRKLKVQYCYIVKIEKISELVPYCMERANPLRIMFFCRVFKILRMRQINLPPFSRLYKPESTTTSPKFCVLSLPFTKLKNIEKVISVILPKFANRFYTLNRFLYCGSLFRVSPYWRSIFGA